MNEELTHEQQKILASLDECFSKFEQKIEQKMNNNLDEFLAKFNQRINESFDGMDTSLSRLKKSFDKFECTLDSINGTIYSPGMFGSAPIRVSCGELLTRYEPANFDGSSQKGVIFLGTGSYRLRKEFVPLKSPSIVDHYRSGSRARFVSESEYFLPEDN